MGAFAGYGGTFWAGETNLQARDPGVAGVSSASAAEVQQQHQGIADTIVSAISGIAHDILVYKSERAGVRPPPQTTGPPSDKSPQGASALPQGWWSGLLWVGVGVLGIGLVALVLTRK